MRGTDSHRSVSYKRDRVAATMLVPPKNFELNQAPSGPQFQADWDDGDAWDDRNVIYQIAWGLDGGAFDQMNWTSLPNEDFPYDQEGGYPNPGDTYMARVRKLYHPRWRWQRPSIDSIARIKVAQVGPQHVGYAFDRTPDTSVLIHFMLYDESSGTVLLDKNLGLLPATSLKVNSYAVDPQPAEGQMVRLGITYTVADLDWRSAEPFPWGTEYDALELNAGEWSNMNTEVVP